jgi:hypothetical protein
MPVKIKLLLALLAAAVSVWLFSPPLRVNAQPQPWTFTEDSLPGRTSCVLTYSVGSEYIRLEAIVPEGVMFMFRSPALQRFAGDRGVVVGVDPGDGSRQINRPGWTTNWHAETLIVSHPRSGPLHVLFDAADNRMRLNINDQNVLTTTPSVGMKSRLYQCFQRANARRS